jgi:hypothetical protein
LNLSGGIDRLPVISQEAIGMLMSWTSCSIKRGAHVAVTWRIVIANGNGLSRHPTTSCGALGLAAVLDSQKRLIGIVTKTSSSAWCKSARSNPRCSRPSIAPDSEFGRCSQARHASLGEIPNCRLPSDRIPLKANVVA